MSSYYREFWIHSNYDYARIGNQYLNVVCNSFSMECISTNMFRHVYGTFWRWFIVVRLPWSWLNLEIVSYFSICLFSSLYSVYFFSLFSVYHGLRLFFYIFFFSSGYVVRLPVYSGYVLVFLSLFSLFVAVCRLFGMMIAVRCERPIKGNVWITVPASFLSILILAISAGLHDMRWGS